MNETIDALEKILAVERTAINDSDAWTEIKVTARAALALARAEQAEPTHKESLSVAPTASAKLEPLSNAEIDLCFEELGFGESVSWYSIARKIEAAHNAKLENKV